MNLCWSEFTSVVRLDPSMIQRLCNFHKGVRPGYWIFRCNFKLLATVWRLPMFKRWPIHSTVITVITVSRRRRRAMITFFRSVFFRSISSFSDQCRFLSSALTIRSAFCSALSRISSPSWCFPALPAICSSSCSFSSAAP